MIPIGVPPQNPDRLSYSPNYDKELYDHVRTELSNCYNLLISEAKESPYLTDPDGLGRISALLNDMKMLLVTYREDIPERDELELELMLAKHYPMQDTATQKGLLKQFITIRDKFISIMAHKHAFMDKVEKVMPWEEQVKKKYNLPELSGPALTWFNLYCNNKNEPKHHRKWKKIAFYWTYYCVARKGDIHCLVTGINNAGKTNTAVPMLKFANFALRDCWHVNEDANGSDPKDLGKIELHQFNMDTDIVYDPDPTVLNSLLEKNLFYQTLDVTEGMGSATNLQSMDKKVIKLGVKAYRIRYRRNIVLWEYQITERPPKLLMTRFNSWIHKMNWFWGVLSIPSSFYRTKDPLYLKRIEDIADSDTKLARWFANKRQNPGYTIKFKTPHMGPRMQAHFDRNMVLADKRMMENEEMAEKITSKYFSIVKDIWTKVNINHYMADAEIDTDLISKGLNKNQIDKIKKLYDQYDAAQKYNVVKPLPVE